SVYAAAFITRSGVISSVHAFGKSAIGPCYLIFIGACATICFALYFLRSHVIYEPAEAGFNRMGKEFIISIMLFLMLSLAAVVFLGTVFPVISEVVSRQKISVQAPYFNAFFPYIGLALLCMLGLSPFFRYQRSGLHVRNRKMFFIAALFSMVIACAVILYFKVVSFSRAISLWIELPVIFVSSFAFCAMISDYISKLPRGREPVSVWLKDRVSSLGTLLAHLGLLIMAFGFLGNYRVFSKEVTLSPGGKTALSVYEFTMAGKVEARKKDNVTIIEVPIGIAGDHGESSMVMPAQAVYPTNVKQTFTEVAVKEGIVEDIYVVLKDWDRSSGNSATLSININPTVSEVWIAAFIMILGVSISILKVKRLD
ncbi:MAG: hypothetical protein HQK54_07745, partial [Oligoflexales bacterium]|nr:hypothetical protein [Oligoflexales bacterium]